MGKFEVVQNAFCIMKLLQAYGGQGVKCGCPKENGPHRLMGGVALLE